MTRWKVLSGSEYKVKVEFQIHPIYGKEAGALFKGPYCSRIS